jgi:heat shock protein beta
VKQLRLNSHRDCRRFLARVDRVLRRSLGVSETAPTDDTVKPAPPVDPELPTDIHMGDEKMFFGLPDEMKGGNPFELEMEEIDEEGNVIRDEL